ncbi:LLM class F420-dependent oxidoreductase [Rhabdothermincola sediminis]|uniref:LLM class F420-dependent oxidoreductase n=1 Tax=Rhabdothermincola sediminis TaxID=2751370 RepID=UPI001AA03FA8|nr:LLM class F420-dependent oxidoreductase [Rhabdothermincola sediminis]
MRFGVTMFATDRSMDVVELAREAEARGFGSIYLPEHTHIPVSRRTPPPTGDAELPEEYARTLDPLVALAAAASVTSSIRLGTGVALPAQRDPIVTAKAIATLDLVSGGRFVFGIGFGWNEDELEDHGVAMADRRAVCRERVLAMRSLWTQDVGGYQGEFTRIAPSWSWPKPVQRPHPPILLGGGAGPKLFAHIVEYANGWIPIGGAGLSSSLPQLRAQWAEAGRDPEELEVVPFGSIPDPGKLEHFERIGVTECVFRLPSATRDEVLPVLDRWAALLVR